mmetsp:Transcript_19186/g.21747  ORF Transcript_19186/g.21747 Transcript_19186/m.21747 type:complete len:575 (+) Transcript_19186:73-1797(+)
MSSFKRVISNPEEIGRDNAKMSKQSQTVAGKSDSTKEDTLAPAMNSLAIGSEAKGRVEADTILALKENSKVYSPQTLIDEDVEDNNEMINTNIDERKHEEVDKQHEMLGDLKPSVSGEENVESVFARQISVDSSAPPASVVYVVRNEMMNGNKVNTDDSGSCRPPVRTSSVASSVIRNKSGSTVESSGNAMDGWGWFQDLHDPAKGKSPSDEKGDKKRSLLLFDSLVNPLNDIGLNNIGEKQESDEAITGVTAPTYVLEESQSSQQLWKKTAGTRPPQPVDERAFYEKVWANNFHKSHVDYKIPADILTATSPISLSPFTDGHFGDEGQSFSNPDNYISTTGNAAGGVLTSDVATVSSVASKASAGASGFYGSSRTTKNLKMLGPHNLHHTLVNKTVKGNGDEMTVLVRGDNVFGTTVSKSFPKKGTDAGIDTVTVSIASYRVVYSKKYGKYAQYLVIFCEGTFRNTVGVWKRYSDFENLSRRVSHGNETCHTSFNPLTITDEGPQDAEILPNAITSWNLLKKRKRWYRCLDAGYLSLKSFLLERFLHDILFESSSPVILRDFVGVNEKGEPTS